MSEAEFDRLLDAVRTAIEPVSREDFLAHPQKLFLWMGVKPTEPPKAANDNQPAWPHMPFPEGWYAAC